MHEFQLRQRHGRLAVTCACLLTRTRGPEDLARLRPEQRPGAVLLPRSVWQRGIIEARNGAFPAGEARAAYRDWHAGRGIEVAA